MKLHTYEVRVEWTGNDGEGTKTYKGYRRDHAITSEGKPQIQGSSDPSFRGDRSRYNPEELLVASLSSCHMLWYLHLCTVSHIVNACPEETVYTYLFDGDGRMQHPVFFETARSRSGSWRDSRHEVHGPEKRST